MCRKRGDLNERFFLLRTLLFLQFLEFKWVKLGSKILEFRWLKERTNDEY